MFGDDAIVAAFRLPMPTDGLMELIEGMQHCYGDDLVMQQTEGFLTFRIGPVDGAQDLP